MTRRRDDQHRCGGEGQGVRIGRIGVRIPVRMEAGTDDTTARRPAAVV